MIIIINYCQMYSLPENKTLRFMVETIPSKIWQIGPAQAPGKT